MRDRHQQYSIRIRCRHRCHHQKQSEGLRPILIRRAASWQTGNIATTKIYTQNYYYIQLLLLHIRHYVLLHSTVHAYLLPIFSLPKFQPHLRQAQHAPHTINRWSRTRTKRSHFQFCYTI